MSYGFGKTIFPDYDAKFTCTDMECPVVDIPDCLRKELEEVFFMEINDEFWIKYTEYDFSFSKVIDHDGLIRWNVFVKRPYVEPEPVIEEEWPIEEGDIEE